MVHRPYITLSEWAEQQGISVQMAHKLYTAERLPGAYPSGPEGKRGTILLPASTPRPDPQPTGAAAHRK